MKVSWSEEASVPPALLLFTSNELVRSVDQCRVRIWRAGWQDNLEILRLLIAPKERAQPRSVRMESSWSEEKKRCTVPPPWFTYDHHAFGVTAALAGL